MKNYVRYLLTFTLGATSGKDDYALAKKIFKVGFDGDFISWGIIFSGVAPEMDIVVDEIVRNGKFPNFFGDTVAELNQRRMMGSQFLKICQLHSDKLYDGGRANFFLLTRDDQPVKKDFSNVFVARITARK